jgi:NTE family protein
MMDVKNIELLRNLPIFRSLNLASLNRLAERAQFVACRKGDVVVRENERDEAFYVVVSGRLQAYTRLKSGATRVYAHYGSGDCFGEIALLADESYWFTVKCLNDALLLRILREDFQEILRTNPEVMFLFNQIFQDRIRSLREERKRAKWSAIFALYGVRTGVGKALISTNLAASLHAETREPVLVVDMNCHEACLDLTKFEDMVNWTCADISSLVTHHPTGYDILRIALRGTETEANLIPSFFGCLVKRYDYVLVDLPHELSPPVTQSFVQSDEIILITGKEEENLYRSRLLLRDLEHDGVPVAEKAQIILTRSPDDLSNGIEAIERQLGHAIHAHLARVEDAAATVTAQDRPFVLAHPVHPFSLVITRLAREIGNVRVGLALGSGAARGLAHIGVIRVLEQEGILVDVVSGASMGAFIGAVWAAGKSADEMEEIALRLNSKRAFFGLLDFAWMRGGFIKGRKIEAFLRSILGDKTFGDTFIDLRVIATDLNTTEEVVFREGSLVDAVRASIAIPGVITPTRSNGHVLIDGGISSPVPIGVLERMGVSKIIAVNTIPHAELMREYQQMHHELGALPKAQKPMYDTFRRTTRWHLDNNIMDINMRAMHAMQSQIAATACANADVVIRPIILDSVWYEFYDPIKYIRKGEESARAILPALKKLVGR